MTDVRLMSPFEHSGRLGVQEPDVEVLVSMLTSVEELLGIGGPDLVLLERVGQVLAQLQFVVTSSEERRTERGERTAAEDFDEEEAEALQVVPSPSGLAVGAPPCPISDARTKETAPAWSIRLSGRLYSSCWYYCCQS